jgi:hypothetical protein
MIAGRIGAMIVDGVNPLTHPATIIIVRAGVDTRVAAPAALVALAWVTRRHLPAELDRLAPLSLVGLAGWHAGCVWRGTCLGTPSSLPWAYSLPGSPITRHPVELYAAAALFGAALIVARLPRRPWLATGTAIAAAGVVRVATQPLRPTITGGPVGFYLLAVVVGVGLAGWALSQRDPHPAARPILDGDSTAVSLDDAPGDRQPEP